MAWWRTLFSLVIAAHALAYNSPGQFRHEQLSAMQAAYSRFGSQGVGGSISRGDLPDFLRHVVLVASTESLTQEQVVSRSEALMTRIVEHLPETRDSFSLEDILRGTEQILVYPPATPEELADERGRLGSKQLRVLRKRLARNRLTMPLFDTRGWVRDFEKALKIQWEIWANGLAPMHIVIARSDRLYGTEIVTPEYGEALNHPGGGI